MTFLSNPLPKFGQAVPWASSKQWPHSQSTAYSNSTHWTKDISKKNATSQNQNKSSPKKESEYQKRFEARMLKRKRWNKLSSNYIWTTSGKVCLSVSHLLPAETCLGVWCSMVRSRLNGDLGRLGTLICPHKSFLTSHSPLCEPHDLGLELDVFECI